MTKCPEERSQEALQSQTALPDSMLLASTAMSALASIPDPSAHDSGQTRGKHFYDRSVHILMSIVGEQETTGAANSYSNKGPLGPIGLERKTSVKTRATPTRE